VVQVVDIVLRLLEDDWLEVREKASQVLGGLLHCNFIETPDDLIVSSWWYILLSVQWKHTTSLLTLVPLPITLTKFLCGLPESLLKTCHDHLTSKFYVLTIQDYISSAIDAALLLRFNPVIHVAHQVVVSSPSHCAFK
jgi:hypothetical protein